MSSLEIEVRGNMMSAAVQEAASKKSIVIKHEFRKTQPAIGGLFELRLAERALIRDSVNVSGGGPRRGSICCFLSATRPYINVLYAIPASDHHSSETVRACSFHVAHLVLLT